MATPVGHGLLGIVVLSLLRRQPANNTVGWYMYSIFAANAADLDFIPGLLYGDVNLFHQGPTHSIFAAFIFGSISIIFASLLEVRKFSMAILGSLTYMSHLVLDIFGHDRREPFGLPLAWPFMESHWKAPYELFFGIKHGVPGDTLTEFLHKVFSLHNLVAIGYEILFVLPLLVLTLLWNRHRSETAQ